MGGRRALLLLALAAACSTAHGWWWDDHIRYWNNVRNQWQNEVNNLNNWARNTLNSRVGILDQAANLKRQTADLRSQIARLENAPKPAAVSAESQKLDEEALDIAREKNTANVERTQAVFDEKAAATDLKSEQQRSAETQNLVAKAAAEVEKLQASSSNSGRTAVETEAILKTQLEAARTRVASAKAEAAKVATLTAAEIEQARQSSNAVAKQRVDVESRVTEAEKSVTEANERLAEERLAAKDERSYIAKKVTGAITKAKAARKLAEDRLAAARLASETAVREAAAAKARADRSAAQLHTSLTENEAALVTLKKTLTELKERHTKLASEEVTSQAARSAESGSKRKRVLSGTLQRMTDLQAQLQLRNDQRAAAMARSKAELEYATARMARQRNETADEIKAIAVERKTLYTAFKAARVALASWRLQASGIEARLDNETAQREGATQALKQMLTGAVERTALADKTFAADMKAADAASDALRERRVERAKVWEAERVNAGREAAAQASTADEARTARARVREEAVRSGIERTAALRAQQQTLSGEVESLRSRRNALRVEVGVVKQERQRIGSELSATDAEWAGMSTAINALQLRKGELEAALIGLAGTIEATRSGVGTRETALRLAGTEMRRAEGIRDAAAAKVKVAEEGVDRANKEMRAAAAGNARFEKMRAVQATIQQLGDAISKAGQRLRAAETGRATLVRQIADLTDRKAALAADLAEVETRLAARREQATVSTGSDAELRQRLAELSQSLERAQKAETAKTAEGRKQLRAISEKQTALVGAYEKKLRGVLRKRARLVEQLKQHLKRKDAAQRKAVALAAKGGAAAGAARPTAKAAAPGSPAAGAAAAVAAGKGAAAAAAASAKGPSAKGTPGPKPTPAPPQPDNASLLVRIDVLQKMIEGLVRSKAAAAAAAARPSPAPVSDVKLSVDDRTVASVTGPSPSASPEPPMFVVPSTGLRPVLDEAGQPLPVVSVTRVEATRAAAPPRPRLRSARMQQDEASAWPPSLLRGGDGPLPR